MAEEWIPKTRLGKLVAKGEITSMSDALKTGYPLKEVEIVDALLPEMEDQVLDVNMVQRMTDSGRRTKFRVNVVVGNKDGLVGIGYGKSRETVPSREKAFRSAKLNIIKIRRGCGSWQCGCSSAHSIPFKVEGKCGSVRIKLMPAPKGTGLCIEKECAKILELAGVKDIWSKTEGQTKTKMNLIYACFDALKNLMKTKIKEKDIESLGIKEVKTENGK